MRYLIFVFALLAAPAAAQDSTGPPPVPEEAVEEIAAIVQEAASEPVPDAEARAVAAELAVAAGESAEAVAKGDATVAEATRDPADAPDPGESGTFWLLSIIFVMVLRPILEIFGEKAARFDSRLTGVVYGAGIIGFFVAAWAVLHGIRPELPQDPESWVIAGLAGVGAGSMLSSGMRARSNGPPARAVALALLLLLPVASCASVPPSGQVVAGERILAAFDKLAGAIEVGVVVKREVMEAAGEARARGAITASQLESVRQAGLRAEAALLAAKAAGVAATTPGAAQGDPAVLQAAVEATIRDVVRALAAVQGGGA